MSGSKLRVEHFNSNCLLATSLQLPRGSLDCKGQGPVMALKSGHRLGDGVPTGWRRPLREGVPPLTHGAITWEAGKTSTAWVPPPRSSGCSEPLLHPQRGGGRGSCAARAGSRGLQDLEGTEAWTGPSPGQAHAGQAEKPAGTGQGDEPPQRSGHSRKGRSSRGRMRAARSCEQRCRAAD